LIELLHLTTSKPVVVSLAIVGAILATFAPGIGRILVIFLTAENTPKRVSILNRNTKIVLWFGYMIMFLSIFLFIVSGFIVDLS